MKNTIKYLFTLLIIVEIFSGCNDFLTPSLDQSKTTKTAIQNASDLQSTVNGAVGQLGPRFLYGRAFIANPAVESDNAFSNAHSGRYVDADRLNWTINSGYAANLWSSFYNVVATVNLALQTDLKSSQKVDNVKGQGYALRALAHMNLLLAFGQEYVKGGDPSKGIPYITTYNKGNLYPSRNSISDTWNKIGKDFSKGISLMDKSNFDPSIMNYWAAKALQTRYFLYTKQYDKLKNAAKEIIDSGKFSITSKSNYNSTWSSGNVPEPLFELVYTSSDNLGNYSLGYVYQKSDYGDVSVTDDLYNAYSNGDVRLNLYSKDSTKSVSSFYRITGKYNDLQGIYNISVIRYAEVILNYAEALAQDPSTQPQALTQLTKITSNRNAPPYSAGTVKNVLKERRLELAMEGQRFYDLARTGREIPVADENSFRSEVIPGGDYRFALPIPNGEIQANSNITQNQGYK